MGLLDEAMSLTNRPGGRCSVSLLDDDLRAEVEAALELVDGRTLTSKAIAAALRNRGADVREQALRRHLRGDCRCAPR